MSFQAGDYYDPNADKLDDMFTDFDRQISTTLRQGFAVVIYVSIGGVVILILSPLWVCVMSATNEAASVTSQALKSLTALVEDVGVFVSEVTFPLIVGALVYAFLKVAQHA